MHADVNLKRVKLFLWSYKKKLTLLLARVCCVLFVEQGTNECSMLKQFLHFFFVCSLYFSGGFPGSQPVSMDVQNIKLLHEKPYRVSWKADGVR